jgi:uncharacterized protein YbbK (DUF523 family)
MKLVSACLVGVKCRYNGKDSLNPKILEEFMKGDMFPICPEVMGGMPIPRPAAEIAGGDGSDVLDDKADVVYQSGICASEVFVHGANQVLRIAKAVGAKEAILKSGSPSCGCGKIYDGSFTGKTKIGDGVTAALLKELGLKVRSDEEF